jgi:hypothetical protein
MDDRYHKFLFDISRKAALIMGLLRSVFRPTLRYRSVAVNQSCNCNKLRDGCDLKMITSL